MDKLLRILVLFVLLTGCIHAQFLGGRRLVFMGDRSLALRRAFPFGVPLAFRRGFIPSSLSNRLRLARLASLARRRRLVRSRGRPFAFGPEPFPAFGEFGGGFPTSPFGAGAAFTPGFFDGGRFVGSPTFGAAGEPGFFPPGTGFPAGSGFPDGSVAPGGAGFTPGGDVSGTAGPAGGAQPTTGVDGGAGTMGPTEFAGSPAVPQIPSVPADGGFTGTGTMTPGMTSPGGSFPASTGGGMAGSDMTGSGMAGTDMSGTGMTGPGIGAPGMTAPGMTAPGFTGAGMTSPGMTGAGMTSPGFTGTGMAGAGAGGPAFVSPMFPAGGAGAFTPGFGRPMTAPFPSGTGATGGFTAGASAPNGRFAGATTGFAPGFAPSERPGFTAPSAGMTVDGRFFASGGSPAGGATAFAGRPGFTGDPRFGAFGPTAGFTGRGPAFSTPGVATDPSMNLQFQPFPGAGMAGRPGTGMAGAGFAGAPGTGFAGAPGTGFAGAPGTGFAGAPSAGFAGAPGTGFAGAPSAGFAGAPGAGFSGAPSAGFAGAPAAGMSGVSGQFDGSQGAGRFQGGADMRNPNQGMTSNNNFNSFTGSANNQVVPPSGTGAARIDGFGTVSSTNNLNTDPNNVVASNTNTNNNPSGIVRFETGASSVPAEVVMNDANSNAAGSEFRVVEVNNILDKSGTSGSVSSTDQSVVDSLGFDSTGEANIASSDLTANTVVSGGNQPGNDNMGLSSPMTNTDFSFFVPPENTNTNTAVDQGATFNAPNPPPPPPIMVPNNNNNAADIPNSNEIIKPKEKIGFVTHGPNGSGIMTFPIIGTDGAAPAGSQPNTDIYDNINNLLPTAQGNPDELLQPSISSEMAPQSDNMGNII